MSNTPTRLSEFHGLIGNYAFYERNLRFSDYQPDASSRADHEAMRRRLDDLARLCNMDDESGTHYDVDEQVERWIEGNPLGMTGTGIKRVIDKTSGQGNGVSAGIQIGDPNKGGRYFRLHEGQLTIGYGGVLLFTLPDSVAEEFRQQGRRALQREHAALMAVEPRG